MYSPFCLIIIRSLHHIDKMYWNCCGFFFIFLPESDLLFRDLPKSFKIASHCIRKKITWRQFNYASWKHHIFRNYRRMRHTLCFSYFSKAVRVTLACTKPSRMFCLSSMCASLKDKMISLSLFGKTATENFTILQKTKNMKITEPRDTKHFVIG